MVLPCLSALWNVKPFLDDISLVLETALFVLVKFRDLRIQQTGLGLISDLLTHSEALSKTVDILQVLDIEQRDSLVHEYSLQILCLLLSRSPDLAKSTAEAFCNEFSENPWIPRLKIFLNKCR